MYIRLPLLLRFFGLPNSFSFHPTLSKVLEKRAGAAQDFREWVNEIADRWQEAENLCAAHTATLQASGQEPSIHERIIAALTKVESTLQAHEKKYA
jgi:hypothetical protein